MMPNCQLRYTARHLPPREREIHPANTAACHAGTAVLKPFGNTSELPTFAMQQARGGTRYVTNSLRSLMILPISSPSGRSPRAKDFKFGNEKHARTDGPAAVDRVHSPSQHVMRNNVAIRLPFFSCFPRLPRLKWLSYL